MNFYFGRYDKSTAQMVRHFVANVCKSQSRFSKIALDFFMGEKNENSFDNRRK